MLFIKNNTCYILVQAPNISLDERQNEKKVTSNTAQEPSDFSEAGK